MFFFFDTKGYVVFWLLKYVPWGIIVCLVPLYDSWWLTWLYGDGAAASY